MPSIPAKVPPKRIVFLAFPGVLLLDIAGPAQVFQAARRRAGQSADDGASPVYRLEIVSRAGGPVATDTGIVLQTSPWEDDAPVDTLVVPGGDVAAAERDPVLLAWVRSAAARARRTSSVCVGAFILAAAGLLDGRRATTHWLHCHDLGARYPGVRVEADPIFVHDDDIWTAAGVTSGIDLALAMVEEDLGHAAALDVARRLVVFVKRPGGQAQFSRTLAAQASSASGEFEALHAWMLDHLDTDLRVERLAERVRRSPRSFARHYLAHTGETPARRVEAMRVEAARSLLETQPDIGVAAVAHRCGFGDDERMRRAFLRRIGVAPADYRARFGVRAGSAASGQPINPPPSMSSTVPVT